MSVLQSDIDSLKTAGRDCQKRLDEIQERRRILEQQQRLETLDHLKPLAIRAHDLLCPWNHTDGCGWLYEIEYTEHNWTGGTYSAHATWLAKVEDWTRYREFGRQLTPEVLDAILDVIAAGKKQHRDFLFIVRQVMTR